MRLLERVHTPSRVHASSRARPYAIFRVLNASSCARLCSLARSASSCVCHLAYRRLYALARVLVRHLARAPASSRARFFNLSRDLIRLRARAHAPYFERSCALSCAFKRQPARVHAPFRARSCALACSRVSCAISRAPMFLSCALMRPCVLSCLMRHLARAHVPFVRSYAPLHARSFANSRV